MRKCRTRGQSHEMMFRLWLTLAGAVACGACSSSKVERVDDPYSGDAPFPDLRPHLELPSTDLGIVSNNGSDTITVLDLDQRKVIATAPVGLDPVAIDGPHHITVDRRRGVVFTALSYPAPAAAPGPHAAHGSSQRAGYVQALDLRDLAPLAKARVETNPGDIVLSPDGSRLVVSHFDLLRARASAVEDRRADLAVIDAKRMISEGDAAVDFMRVCVAPHGVSLLGSSGDIAIVACYGEDALAIVDTTNTSAKPELVSVGPGGTPGSPIYGPYAAILSPDSALVAVSDTLSSDVRLFDVASRSFSTAIATGGAPYFGAWSADGSRLFVPIQNPDGLAIVDASKNKVQSTHLFDAKDCVLPHAVVFATDASVLYLVCEGDHQSESVVLALDPQTLEQVGSMPVGVYPDGLSITRGVP
jgi:YVTN family beta-propeller protein